LQKAWLRATAEVMKGKYDKADAVDPNFLNHVTWYSATDWKRPYPRENKVEIPGPFVKAAKKTGPAECAWRALPPGSGGGHRFLRP
jgi:hypothetical protein